MPIEHEHKFILTDFAAAEAACVAERYERMDLRQFYLAEGCRFRSVSRDGAEPVHLFTYKRLIGGRLLEVETSVSAEDFGLAMTEAKEVLSKTRYDREADGEHWSVDFLRSRDGTTYFALAEVETPEGTGFAIPGFIAPFVTLAVPHGDNDRFANARLIDPAYAASCLAAYLSR